MATQRNFAVVIKNFDRFSQEKYHRSGDQIIAEYLKAEKGQIYDSIQDWINWNSNRGISANTIPMWFSCLKKIHQVQKCKDKHGRCTGIS